MPANPVEAGRKGGSSKSPAKQAASRRNGFQRVYPRQEDAQTQPVLPTEKEKQ
jgi:hypothetical protein